MDGMGWDGMGWDGIGWDGMGWDGMDGWPDRRIDRSMHSDPGVQPWVRRHPSRLRSPSEVVIGAPVGVQAPSAPQKGFQQNRSSTPILTMTRVPSPKRYCLP